MKARNVFTSFVVTAKQSVPSSASRFCRLVLGPCELQAGMLVLASPMWTVMRGLTETGYNEFLLTG